MRGRLPNPRTAVAMTLIAVLVAGIVGAVRISERNSRTVVVAYFDNSTGLFVGDDVRIRGVRVGKVERIEPQPQRAMITFWFDRKFNVPAEALAVILSPQLVSGRAIQLTPHTAVGQLWIAAR